MDPSNGMNSGLLNEKALQLEERARQLAFLEDQELKRGSSLNIIPPTPIVKRNQSPAVAAAQQAVITTLRQHGTSPQIGTVSPVLVPTMPLAASYLHQQMQPTQQGQHNGDNKTAAVAGETNIDANGKAASVGKEKEKVDLTPKPTLPPESQGQNEVVMEDASTAEAEASKEEEQ